MRRGTYLQRNPDRQLNCPALIPSAPARNCPDWGCLQPHCDRTRTHAQGRVLRLNSVMAPAEPARAGCRRDAARLHPICPASTDADLLCATACDPWRRVHGSSGGFVTAIAAYRPKSPPRPASDPTRRRRIPACASRTPASRARGNCPRFRLNRVTELRNAQPYATANCPEANPFCSSLCRLAGLLGRRRTLQRKTQDLSGCAYQNRVSKH